MPFTRRTFLQTAAALLQPRLDAHRASAGAFSHGVASGDPFEDRVVIWTRVTPRQLQTVRVRWEVRTDTMPGIVVRSGTVSTSAVRDFTVKVDVAGLLPGREYVYRFEALGEASPSGRTRTLPAHTSRLRLAVVSCSNYPAGFFNAYAAIAAREDIDAVVHLGDYIYEFANGVFGDGAIINRVPDPEHETLTLDDYRRRYATYRSDVDLQAVHARHPFITVWDDHEFADNAWAGGVGEWARRRAAAMRAYLEWMPVREAGRPELFHLYRRFAFGRLATLVMLDTRSDRDGQVFATDQRAITDPRRRLIGARQERWLGQTIRDASQTGVAWTLIGQQVMFSPFFPPDRPIRNPDSWDGYQAERNRVRDLLASASNAAILTGDTHGSGAYDVPRDPWSGYHPDSGEGSIAVELIAPAVSSPPFFSGDEKQTLGPQIWSSQPHLKFLEGENRGFMLLDIRPERLQASWHLTPDVSRRSPASTLAASFVVEAGSHRLSRG